VTPPVRVTVQGIEADRTAAGTRRRAADRPGCGRRCCPGEPRTCGHDVWFSEGGMNLSGTLDVADIVRNLAH
jgi:hypothetical protein